MVLSDRIAALGRSPWRRAALLLAIMLLGALVRLDVLRVWLQEPGLYFHEGVPLERSVDGYRSLAHARDLLRGDYAGVDERRRVPDYPARPSPPLLIAIAAAALQRTTGLELETIAALLPVLLGPLIALPLYLLGRHLGGTAMGLTAALFGTLTPFYVARSNFGWFDTDILNVTLALATASVALRFGSARGSARWGWLLAWALLTGLFIWWWWPARPVALGLALVPLVVALALHYRPAPREALAMLPLLAVLFAAGFLLADSDPLRLLRRAESLFGYVSKAPLSGLPRISTINMEQIRLPLGVSAAWTAGSWLGFGLGAFGLLWMLRRQPARMLYLAGLIAVGLLGLLFAVRFLIFAAPLFALGVGYVAARLWQCRRRRPALGLLTLVGIPLLLWPALDQMMGARARLHQPAPMVALLDQAGRQLPADAVIWANWGHGNAIFYWADRGTIADGDYHGPRITIYSAYPLTRDYDRLAANFMRLVVARGESGLERWVAAHRDDRAAAFERLERLLAAGPELAGRLLREQPPRAAGRWQSADDWVRFLFPAKARPLYLLLDPTLADSVPAWWPMGTWDYRTSGGQQTAYAFFQGLQLSQSADGDRLRLPPRIATADDDLNLNLDLDLDQGLLRHDDQTIPLTQLLVLGAEGADIQRWPRADGYRLEINADDGTAALMEPAMAASLFNRLYLRDADSKYFLPIPTDTPGYGLWQVRAEPAP
jgi:dolichyl-diphosphooligosaccharide--protein glycosyltransferase